MKTKAWLIMGIIIGSSLFFICSAQSQNIADKTIDYLRTKKLEAIEKAAKDDVRIIASESERYAIYSNGIFPSSLNDLVNSKPFFMPVSIAEGNGRYKYFLESKPNYYKIVAVPLECGRTGNKVFIKERDKEIIEQNCQ